MKTKLIRVAAFLLLTVSLSSCFWGHHGHGGGRGHGGGHGPVRGHGHTSGH